MRIDILTLFPELFAGFLATSIPRIALEKGALEVELTDLRGFAEDQRGSVDDRPFGGGPGMVLCCGPVFRAVEAIELIGPKPRRILLSPQGRRLDQARVDALAREERLLLMCGHYEGFDERIRLGLEPEELSIGDYVLSGGEVAAMVLVDALARLLPGVVGRDESVRDDSFSRADGFLEGPQYTRPRVFRGMEVPEVLLSGHHERIDAWRLEQSVQRTRERRPELLVEGGASAAGDGIEEEAT